MKNVILLYLYYKRVNEEKGKRWLLNGEMEKLEVEYSKKITYTFTHRNNKYTYMTEITNSEEGFRRFRKQILNESA